MAAVLTDDDIRSTVGARDAVRWMGQAVDAHHRGALLAPARVHADLDGGRLAFTAGRLRGDWFGFRSYDTFPAGPGEQVVVVHDERSGSVRGIAVGNELGLRRTGAIGGVAADALAPPDAHVAAIIGTGTQAQAQLWALSAVRELREVRAFSRSPARRDAFADAANCAGIPCRVATSARDAVEGAQVVILATTSPTPVLDAAWLQPGAFVATLGPKQQGRAEFGVDLPASADLLVTDSPAQLHAYDPANVLVGTGHAERVVSLGAIRAAAAPLPAREACSAISVFFSVGLAGTEVFLLDRALAADRAGRRPA